MDTPDFPEVPFAGVTELRIHGVSGTPTESMLQNAHPVQVWGDRSAGFYRTAHDHGPPDPQPPAPPGRTLEAYSWGGLTAGKGERAAWLLLLPFMLLNVAAWAHPSRRASRYAPVGWMSGALRVLGLTLTGVLVLAAATIGMDMLAWQCAGTQACGEAHFYTEFLTDGRLSDPGTRIAVGALLPVLLLTLMRTLSKSTTETYEHAYELAPNAPVPGGDEVPLGVRDLANHRFWNGGPPLSRLRALHVTAATAGVAALVAHAAQWNDPSGYDAVATVVVAVALTLIALVAGLLMSPLTGRRRELLTDERARPAHPAYCTAVRYGPYAAALLLATAAFYSAFVSERPHYEGRLPGFAPAADWLLVTQAVLLVVLLLANAVTLWHGRRYEREALRGLMFKGLGAWFLAVFGLVLGSAYASGLALRFADLVGNPAPTACRTDCPSSPIYLSEEYFWSARGFAAAVALALVAAVWVVRLKKRLAKRAAAAVREEYPEHAGDPGRVEAIAKAHAAAALVDDAGGPAMLVVVGTCVATAVMWRFFRDDEWIDPLTTAGTFLTGGFALALFGVARSAYRNPRLRRTVGILWDLGTFWPRSAHPFAPPCYCERSIPEFTTRVRQIRDAGGDVVVSAHSQGTVIAAAAAMQLHAELDGVALLTYGSPLQRLYARTFPHFFGTPSLRWLDGALGGRWVNLYRRTDPIGAPVLRLDEQPSASPDARPDRRLRDPAFATPRYAFHPPKTRAHSDYWDDAAFASTVDELAGELTARNDPPARPQGTTRRRSAAKPPV
ncbi:MAG TPA: hypothetical protein VGX28_16170 [Frankiaceae bacterium]|jgi:hypothetical protein|nr:hypothetical protein [Frankiaceae bacterium]